MDSGDSADHITGTTGRDAALLRDLRDARQPMAVLLEGADVARDEDLRMSGHRQVGVDLEAAGAIGRRTQPFGGSMKCSLHSQGVAAMREP